MAKQIPSLEEVARVVQGVMETKACPTTQMVVRATRHYFHLDTDEETENLIRRAEAEGLILPGDNPFLL